MVVRFRSDTFHSLPLEGGKDRGEGVEAFIFTLPFIPSPQREGRIKVASQSAPGQFLSLPLEGGGSGWG